MSPTTPIYALRYPAPADPADVPTDMGELATDVESKLLLGGVSYGTTPPATPVDGQLWCYPADTANGIIWMFRYRTGSPNAEKWEFAGGPPISSTINTGETTTATGTFVNVATVGPAITLPLTGGYRFEMSTAVSFSVANSNIVLGVGIGDFSGPLASYSANIYTGNAWGCITAVNTLGIQSSGTQIRLKYQNAGGVGGTMTVASRNLSIYPTRIS